MLVGASLTTWARIGRRRRDSYVSVAATQSGKRDRRSRVSRGTRRPLRSEGRRVAGRRAALRPEVRCLAGGSSEYARTKEAAAGFSNGLAPALGAGAGGSTVHPSPHPTRPEAHRHEAGRHRACPSQQPSADPFGDGRAERVCPVGKPRGFAGPLVRKISMHRVGPFGWIKTRPSSFVVYKWANRRRQPALRSLKLKPPSITIVCPVIDRAMSDARNTAASAISCT